MTDASPLNGYLLFEHCSDFQTNNKILYALNNTVCHKDAIPAPLSADPGLSSKRLVRNIEDLKHLVSKREHTIFSCTNTEASSKDSKTAPELSPITPFAQPLAQHAANAHEGQHLGVLGATEALDARPWDTIEEHGDHWNWSIETMYQNYHLCIALDFGQRIFGVCKNGAVYADRVPVIVDTLLQSIRVMLETREQDVRMLSKWIATNVKGKRRRQLAQQQLWNPKIAMTILLLNVPEIAQVVAPLTPDYEACLEMDTRALNPGSQTDRLGAVPFFPVDGSPFLMLGLSNLTEGPGACTSIPLLSVGDVRVLLEDASFMNRLRHTLLMYENAYRDKARAWHESSLSSSLEYLIHLAPEASRECHSIVLVTNTCLTTSSECLSFAEGVVRRKNLILSVVTLNYQPTFETPELSPLAYFIHSVGGFLVNIHYWTALASSRSNRDWCHRFEGARCLSQQLFVQLVRNFPVASYGASEWYSSAECAHRVPLIGPDWGMEDLVFNRCTPRNILRAVAAARFNEGWSVLMDCKEEMAASHLFARYYHHTGRGILTLHYEMHINFPLMYRRMFVSGNGVLVKDFLSTGRSEEPSTGSMGRTSQKWLMSLNLLRLQTRSWLKAERLLLSMLDFNSAVIANSSLVETVMLFSFAEGVALEWHNISTVSSMGVFLCYKDLPSQLFQYLGRNTLSSLLPMSVSAAGRAMLKSVMLQSHQLISKEDELIFVSREAARVPLYVVQFFHINGPSSAEFMLASGFECRVSFFLCDVATQREVVFDLIDTITKSPTGMAAVGASEAGDTARGAFADGAMHSSPLSSASVSPILLLASTSLGGLTVSVSLSSANRQALLVSLIATSSESFAQLSFCADPTSSVNRPMLSGLLQGTKSARPSSLAQASRLKPRTLGALQRTLLTSYVVTPWILTKTLRERWTFCCSEVYPQTMHEAFVYLIMRRLHEGFKLLLCHTNALRAILQIQKEGTVVVLDIIAVLEKQYLTVSRLVSPYSGSSRAEAWCGIQEDYRILTTLQTFKAFSSLQHNDVGHKMSSQETARQGVTLVRPCIEILLQYLQLSHTEVLDLVSASSLGSKGCDELREKLVCVIGSLGDHCTCLTVSSMREDFARLLSSSSVDLSGLSDTKVLVAVLHPIRYPVVTFVLILEKDTPTGAGNGIVKVALTSLSADVLRFGLTERYRLETARKEFSRLPDCIIDRAVLLSLRRMLTNFASVFVLRQLTGVIQRTEVNECGEERVLRDIHHRLRVFDSYVAEMDASYLLYAIQHQSSDPWRCERRVKATLVHVLTQQAHVFRSDPFLFFPMSITEQVPGKVNVPSRDSERETEKDKKRKNAQGSFSLSEPMAQTATSFTELPIAIKIEASLSISSLTSGVAEEPTRDDAELACKAEAPDHKLRFWVDCEYLTTETDGETSLAEDTRTANFLTHRSMRLRIFFKTVPLEMLELCRDGGFHPAPSTVCSTLRTFISKHISQEALANVARGGLVSTHAAVMHAEDSGEATAVDVFESIETAPYEVSDTYFKLSKPILSLHVTLQRYLSRIQGDLAQRIALFALGTSFKLNSYKELELMIKGHTSDRTGDHDAVGEDHRSDCKDVLTTDPVTGKEQTLFDCLVHDSALTSLHASKLSGVNTLLKTIVKPALLSAVCFETALFALEFTRQATTHRSLDPANAVVDVFKRCVEEDHMCVVSAGDFSYAFIPNSSLFAQRWILVHVEPHAGGSASPQARILYFDALAFASQKALAASFSQQLRNHICKKVVLISQLHLLKQLRDTQYASAELIPPCWGDQFSTGPDEYDPSRTELHRLSVVPHASSGGAAGSASVSTPSFFCLHGRNIIEIPIYYKLQNQCRKILSCISCNSSRLELINIFNREQCFMVADDDETDTFHYIRLVFVKDVPHSTSATSPPPRLNTADRCPLLLVQLFTPTANVSIKRPLQKLQDFCYFLAVQELQGHLSYIQQREISFNDLVFLQNQPLEPLVICLITLPHVAQWEKDEGVAARLVATLLFLNLRENKFKHFEVHTRDQSHATSTFMEHYNLEGGLKQTSTPGGVVRAVLAPHSQTLGVGSTEISHPTADAEARSSLHQDRVLRFVRIIDGPTDVLVSCAVCLSSLTPGTIRIERYLTKIPSERYLDRNLEDGILKQLSDCVSTTVAQLSFHALSTRLGSLQLGELSQATEELLDISASAPLHDASMLRYERFSLDGVSAALYPYFIERLCGLLAPYQPRCCEKKDIGHPSAIEPVHGFPWQWIEAQQNNPVLDRSEMFILCGYTIRAHEGECAQSELAPVRVVPYSLVDLPITTTTVEKANMVALENHGLAQWSNMEWRILVRVSLQRGGFVSLFNLQDSEFIVRLISYVLEDALDRSHLLQSILMQRLQCRMAFARTEPHFTHPCPHDLSSPSARNATLIDSANSRWRVNGVRFRRQESDDEPFWIILEGLYNRGLVVDFAFALEDAVKVLYDDTSIYTLEACEWVVFKYLEDGALLEDKTSNLKPQLSLFRILHPREPEARPIVCRLPLANCILREPLAACNYRRHCIAALKSLEVDSARSRMADLLARCDVLWRSGRQKNVLELSTSVVRLRMRSKQVFGSRVPNFLLRREGWKPENEVLDETLPTPSQENASYSYPVNMALSTYMRHLQRLFPSMHIIDLDPNDTAVASNPVLQKRLRCRYGKVTFNEDEVVCFSPHLYYAVIPFAELLRCGCIARRHKSLLSLANDLSAAQGPIASSGLFIVEVGLQVAHYALDFFVINGSRVPALVTAAVAATFKEKLLFASIIYDATIRLFLQRCTFPAAVLSAHQDMVTAVANLADYYPSPPLMSKNIIVAYHITDPRLVQLRTLRSNVMKSHSASHWQRSTHPPSQHPFTVLQPEQGRVLYKGNSEQRYLCGGLIHWDTAQLFILITTEDEVDAARARHRSRGAAKLVAEAKRRLLLQLLESTQQERIDAAWSKFLSDPRRPSAGSATYNDFELVVQHAHRVLVCSYASWLQRLVGEIVLCGDLETLSCVCQAAFPGHVLRIIWRPSPHEGSSGQDEHTGDLGRPVKATSGETSTCSVEYLQGLFNPIRTPAQLILTFASNNPEDHFIFVLEGRTARMPTVPFVLESLVFYRRLSNASLGVFPPTSLTDEESRLVHAFVLLLVRTMQYAVLDSPLPYAY